MIAILVGKPPFAGKPESSRIKIISKWFSTSDPSLLRWPWFFNDNLVYLWVHEDYPYLWFSWHSRLVLLRKSWEIHSSSWFWVFCPEFPQKTLGHAIHAMRQKWSEIGVPQ
jgi:hypothetical protein